MASGSSKPSGPLSPGFSGAGAHLFPDRSQEPLVVAMNWAWNYITFQRGIRLITGNSGSRIEDVGHEDEIAGAVPASAGQ